MGKTLTKTLKMFVQVLPILGGVLILVSLAVANIPRAWYGKLFTGTLLDPVIGAAAGSIAAGHPITSYIIGGELLRRGVSLLAVTAFIITWVTVGLVQFPAESLLLGRRFAIARNLSAAVLAVLVAALTVLAVNLLGIPPVVRP